MSEQLINNIQDKIEDTLIDIIKNPLKTLRDEITQNIRATLNLLNYNPTQNLGLGILDGSFSVYKIDGQSSVNKPYEFEITFVSDDFINVEDIGNL
jgi:type VI secretion system secreted protein VgrG